MFGVRGEDCLPGLGTRNLGVKRDGARSNKGCMSVCLSGYAKNQDLGAPLRVLTYLLSLTALTALYVGLARLGMFVGNYYGGAASFWPAAGLGLAVVWLYRWRGVPVVVLGSLLAGLLLHDNGWPTGAHTLIVLAEALIGAWLLTRARVKPSFSTLRDAGLFLGLGVIIPALLAGVASAGTLLTSNLITPDVYWHSAFIWSLGDAMGVLIVTPLIAQWRHGWPFACARDGWAWVAIMAATLILVLGTMHYVDVPQGLFFLFLPMVVLAVIVSGMAGATGIATLLALCVLGLGMNATDSHWTAVRILFVGTATLTAYVLAVVLEQRRRVEARLRHASQHDCLTGLPNREAFDQHLKSFAQRAGQHVLLCLDLDEFKLINDSRGHEMGDRFLAALAAELASALPPQAILARLGGDEFGVLATYCDESSAHGLAEQLRQTTIDFCYTESGREYRVSTSIGFALFDSRDEPTVVLSRADIACYAAKREGRNHIQQYRGDDAETRANYTEMQHVAELDSALRNGRIVLMRQQIVPLGDVEEGQPEHYEILMRVRDENGRLTPPGAFLAAGTRYGLMPFIDRWVIEQTFKYLSETSQPLDVSINLVAQTLNDPAVYDDVMALKERYGINANAVCFEVTEQLAIQHLTRAIKTMQRFIDAGFRFALDDFGTGVSSFEYLQDLPISSVKIDGRFIRDIDKDPANPIIVESLARLAKIKKIDCIGEWVETGEILSRIRQLGVSYGQGFHLHKPEPIIMPAAQHPAG